MTNQIVLSPPRVLDANGAPVANATVNFYLPGTTTPAAIYSDAALSVALANPQVTNSAGFLTTGVYSASAVDVVAYTSGGATITGYTFRPAAVPVSGSAAEAITFAATAEIPQTNVQAAIESVVDRIDAQIGVSGWGVATASPLLTSWDGASIAGGAYRWDDTLGGAYPTGWSADSGAAVFARGSATTGFMLAANDESIAFRPLAGSWGTWREIAHDGRIASNADAQTGTGNGYMTATTTKLAIEAQVNTRRRVGSGATPFEPTPGSLIEWAHGLPSRPVLVQLRLRCITTDGGYAVGDEVFISNTPKSDFSRGHTVYIDNDTHVKVRISSDSTPFEFCQKGSATIFYPDTTKWGLIITAQV
jgi:hypothetical protein